MGNEVKKRFEVLTVEKWLEKKQKTEGAEGLWRIGDNLYDVSQWIYKHPGGAQWLQITKGTDITEAFESHHISTKAEDTLSKFFVRKAVSPRAYPYTFHSDGFYRTLKKRIRDELGDKYKGPMLKSVILMDSLVLISLSLCVIAAKYHSFYIGSVAGFFLSLAVICSHNFFHLRDNWRMYYFHFGFLSSRDWRISHVLSHHIYTNTVEDLEITLFEPFFQWLPKEDKNWIARNLSTLYSPFIYPFVAFSQLLKRILTNTCTKADSLILVIPALMLFFGSQDYQFVLILWVYVIVNFSFAFTLIGVTAAHHHPDIYHDGDSHRKDQDWGLHQLDAVRDRMEVKGNTLIALVSFGDHPLHHLFPALDHSILPRLLPVLDQTCREFGLKFTDMPTWNLVRGQFQQLARNKPNSVPPN